MVATVTMASSTRTVSLPTSHSTMLCFHVLDSYQQTLAAIERFETMFLLTFIRHIDPVVGALYV